MRILTEIIDAMLIEVPLSCKLLRSKLTSIKQSSLYAAPEIQVAFWRKCANTLHEEIGEPVKDWEINIATIFSGTGA